LFLLDFQAFPFHSVPFSLLASSSVLALIAFAVLPAFETSLVAFAIFFQAKRLLAIASFQVFVFVNFYTERIRISIHQNHDCSASFFCEFFQVVAPLAVAAITSLIDTETVAVKFQAFGFFTVAKYFFGRRIGLRGNQLFQ
jgi:hypothetical protein